MNNRPAEIDPKVVACNHIAEIDTKIMEIDTKTNLPTTRWINIWTKSSKQWCQTNCNRYQHLKIRAKLIRGKTNHSGESTIAVRTIPLIHDAIVIVIARARRQVHGYPPALESNIGTPEEIRINKAIRQCFRKSRSNNHRKNRNLEKCNVLKGKIE